MHREFLVAQVVFKIGTPKSKVEDYLSSVAPFFHNAGYASPEYRYKYNNRKAESFVLYEKTQAMRIIEVFGGAGPYKKALAKVIGARITFDPDDWIVSPKGLIPSDYIEDTKIAARLYGCYIPDDYFLPDIQYIIEKARTHMVFKGKDVIPIFSENSREHKAKIWRINNQKIIKAQKKKEKENGKNLDSWNRSGLDGRHSDIQPIHQGIDFGDTDAEDND